MRNLPRSLLFAANLSLTLLLLAACGGSDDAGDGDNGDLDLSSYAYSVQTPDVLDDRSHFDPGLTYEDYTSNPPTSGPHASIWADPGIYDVAIPKEQAVHSMEHSNVIVWYNCNAEPSLSNDDCTTLRNALSQVVQSEIGNGKGVVMTPYLGMDSHIALTAWGYLDTFEEFDGERVRTFIETFECNYDPEDFC
jgi:hypothetical protein